MRVCVCACSSVLHRNDVNCSISVFEFVYEYARVRQYTIASIFKRIYLFVCVCVCVFVDSKV